MSVPIIDVSALLNDNNDSSNEVKKAVFELSTACSNIGFFYVSNHGVPKELMNKLYDVTASFFAESPETKNQYSYKLDKIHSRGYVGIGNEKSEDSLNIHKNPEEGDFKECYDAFITWEQENVDNFLSGQRLSTYFIWPQTHGFEDIITSYFKYILKLGYALLRAIQISLNLPSGYFKTEQNKLQNLFRVIHYPPQKTEDGLTLNNRIACSEHRDFGWLTILAQDNVGGLQVKPRNSSEWLDVPPIQDTFVINLGIMMTILTNSNYYAAPHRVITLTKTRPRYSVPVFFEPQNRIVVSTLESCVNEKNPLKYKSIAYGDFLKERIDSTYV